MTTPVTHFIPTRETIEQTYALIAPYLRVTPILETGGASLGGPAVPIVFKLEHLQHAGSFKARGAFANLKLRRVPAAGTHYTILSAAHAPALARDLDAALRDSTSTTA